MQILHRFAALMVFPGRHSAARRYVLFPLSGLLLALPLALPLEAQEVTAAFRPIPDPLALHVSEAAQRFGIPEHWIRAVMQIESAGDSMAVSSAGAMGLMQVMPDTWSVLRASHALGSDPFAPRDNILAGTAYLREMLDRYGNTGAMLAAYNAGPGRYDEYLAGLRDLPSETRAYVAVLAPMLDGDVALPRLVTAPSRVTDWRESSLFSPLSGAAFATVAEPDRRDGSGGTVIEPSRAPLAPVSSEALFVARSGAEVVP